MTDEVIPHFHNDLGVQLIEIGAKKFMCMGALPPQDHPHVFCDMGEDVEYVCCRPSALFVFDVDFGHEVVGGVALGEHGVCAEANRDTRRH